MIVGNVGAGAGQRMNAREIAVSPRSARSFTSSSAATLSGSRFELLGAVLRQLRHGRLGRVPGTRPVLVEVGGGRGEPPQRVAEHRRRLPRHHAAELHPAVLDPAMAAAAVGAEPR